WLRQARSLSPRSAAFNRHVLAPEVADFVEAPAERRGKGRIGRSGIDESDHRYRRLLRVRRERPRHRRTAEQREPSPVRKAWKSRRTRPPGEAEFTNPITGNDCCCAHAPPDHDAAAPPSSVMNSRRVTQSPPRRVAGDAKALRGRALWQF